MSIMILKTPPLLNAYGKFHFVITRSRRMIPHLYSSFPAVFDESALYEKKNITLDEVT